MNEEQEAYLMGNIDYQARSRLPTPLELDELLEGDMLLALETLVIVTSEAEQSGRHMALNNDDRTSLAA